MMTALGQYVLWRWGSVLPHSVVRRHYNVGHSMRTDDQMSRACGSDGPLVQAMATFSLVHRAQRWQPWL